MFYACVSFRVMIPCQNLIAENRDKVLLLQHSSANAVQIDVSESLELMTYLKCEGDKCPLSVYMTPCNTVSKPNQSGFHFLDNVDLYQTYIPCLDDSRRLYSNR